MPVRITKRRFVIGRGEDCDLYLASQFIGPQRIAARLRLVRPDSLIPPQKPLMQGA